MRDASLARRSARELVCFAGRPCVEEMRRGVKLYFYRIFSSSLTIFEVVLVYGG